MINWIIAIVAIAAVVYGIRKFIKDSKNNKDCNGNCSGCNGGCSL